MSCIAKGILKRFLCLVLGAAVLCGQCQAVYAADAESMLDASVRYMLSVVAEPTASSVGGEWAVIGAARSGAETEADYYEKYYNNLKKKLADNNGILHSRKYTEYSRAILALTAIGKDPSDVGGVNLLKPLSDYDKTILQGINGPIWALIALDSGKYELAENEAAPVAATRDMYVEYILSKQNADGGWKLGTAETSDTDITAMALCALSNYAAKADVNAAIDKGLGFLSDMQTDSGGFAYNGTESAETSAQVLTALCTLNIPQDDARFVKNGNTVCDGLERFFLSDGGFCHLIGGGENLMATEQCVYALTALKRFKNGENALWDMSDVAASSDDAPHRAESDIIKISPFIAQKTFADISACKSRGKIEELAARGIINGKSDNMFEPYACMTRAEFAAVVTRALGLEAASENVFSDVGLGDWFCDYVNTAYALGIVSGVSADCFDPYGLITLEEAAVMTARTSIICGIDTSVGNTRDVLSEFTDYTDISDWAAEEVAFCIKSGILPSDVIQLKPQKEITREEIADMLYNMLKSAELI